MCVYACIHCGVHVEVRGQSCRSLSPFTWVSGIKLRFDLYPFSLGQGYLKCVYVWNKPKTKTKTWIFWEQQKGNGNLAFWVFWVQVLGKETRLSPEPTTLGVIGWEIHRVLLALLCDAEDGTQDLSHAKQALHLGVILQGGFKTGSRMMFIPGHSNSLVAGWRFCLGGRKQASAATDRQGWGWKARSVGNSTRMQ